MAKPVPFHTVIEALLNDKKSFPAGYLHRFSDIEPADLKALLKAWPQISPRRKQILLEDLEDLAEADTLLSFDDLGRALLKAPEASTRVMAMRLLWECEDAKLVPIYLDILHHDEDSSARAGAATALGLFVFLGELEKIPSAIHHEVEDNLIQVTRSARETLVRRRSLESLGTSSREEVPSLIEAAYKRKESEWVVSALYAMGRSSDERWKKQVLSNLLNPNEEIRVEAIRAAGGLELQAARPALLDQLEDVEDIELRREIVWSLSKIGGEGIRNRLEELIEVESDDEEVEFLEEAIDNLAFTEDLARFEMFEIGPDDEDR